MYEFLDRPTKTLDAGGSFLVWSMRSWVKAMDERTCPGTVLGPAFARRNVIPGLQPFLRMMALLNWQGLVTFQFCSLQCNHVSEHEAILLSLIGDLRGGRPEAMRGTLALLIEEEAIGDLFASLDVLGRALEKSGLFPGRGLWLPQPAPRAGTRDDLHG